MESIICDCGGEAEWDEENGEFHCTDQDCQLLYDHRGRRLDQGA